MILNKILAKEDWRNYLLFDKDISEHIYQSNNEKINELLHFYNNIMIEKNNKLSYDLLKLNSIKEEFIHIMNKYYSIDDRLLFQYAFSEKQLRLFIQPLYNYKLEKIIKLIPAINNDNYQFFEFDINGAMPRFIFCYLYKVTNDEKFKNIYLIDDDIYLCLMKELKYNGDRNEFKFKFIKYLNHDIVSFDKNNYIIEHIEQHIKNKINIFQGTNYWIFLILKNLIEKNNGEINMYFLNVDGGILYSDNNIIPNYNFLRIKRV